MPIVNITNEQYAQLLTPPSIVDKVMSSPWIISILLCIIVVLIYIHFKGKSPADPSTKAWWGRTVRQEVLTKIFKKHMEQLGTKCKITLEKGTAKVGIIERIQYDKEIFEQERIDPKTKKVYFVPSHYYDIVRFKIRKCGLFGWLKALFGFGYFYMTVTPDSFKERWENKGRTLHFNIDPNVHLINDSDIWTMQNKETIDSNNAFVLKAHTENMHGSEIDFLRRLAVHSPTLAGGLERASHEANLKAEEQKRKSSPYS